jgi:hypothetical protein
MYLFYTTEPFQHLHSQRLKKKHVHEDSKIQPKHIVVNIPLNY